MNTRIHPDEMPAPDALINYSEGVVAAAMFHYAPSEKGREVYEDIAREHGFEITGAVMRETHPLYEKYAEGENVLPQWDPEVPHGWQFAGKHDTEDGPYAVFIRPIGPSR